MAKIDQQQVVEFLKERKLQLNAELQKIQSALDALTGVESGVVKTGKRKYTRRATIASGKSDKASARQSRKRASSGETAQNDTSAPKKTRKPRSAKGPKQERAAGGWDEKILQVLQKNGAASKEDIIRNISRQQPETDPAKLSRAVSLRLAVMAQSDRISTMNEGGTVKYGKELNGSSQS